MQRQKPFFVFVAPHCTALDNCFCDFIAGLLLCEPPFHRPVILIHCFYLETPVMDEYATAAVASMPPTPMDGQSRCVFGIDTVKFDIKILNCSM